MELLAQLFKIVSDLLSSIHSNLKGKVCISSDVQTIIILTAPKLVSSLVKRMSIMDTAKSLAHGIIEVDAAHWNRYTFLVCSLLQYTSTFTLYPFSLLVLMPLTIVLQHDRLLPLLVDLTHSMSTS
jgi:hypothetical protein